MEMYMRNNHGFTLIEVLISLAILSIALMTIIKFTSQNIRDTAYVQNKTIANWVGSQVINEVLAGVLKLSESDHEEQETEMLGRKWSWQASLVSTPNPHIQEVHVDVFQSAGKRKIIGLVSYVYNP